MLHIVHKTSTFFN